MEAVDTSTITNYVFGAFSLLLMGYLGYWVNKSRADNKEHTKEYAALVGDTTKALENNTNALRELRDVTNHYFTQNGGRPRS